MKREYDFNTGIGPQIKKAWIEHLFHQQGFWQTVRTETSNNPRLHLYNPFRKMANDVLYTIINGTNVRKILQIV